MPHGLHRVAEVIKDKYQNVNRFISYTRNIFLEPS